MDALAIRVTDGYAAAAPALRRALEAVLALEVAGDVGRWLWLTGSRAGAIAALELWDADAWHAWPPARSRSPAKWARSSAAVRAPVRRPQPPARWGPGRGGAGDRGGARDRGGDRVPPVAYTEMMLAAWRGQEARAIELIEPTAESNTRGLGRMTHFARYTAAVLNNGLGRYDAALEAARRAFERDHIGYMPFVMPELAEAASRTGDRAARDRARLDVRADRATRRATGRSGWRRACARSRATATRPSALPRVDRAPGPHSRAIELARAHLVYGEWLRREGRRVDAREQLRVAREAFLAMGAEGFAERARHELLATGEKVRKRRDDTRDELTPRRSRSRAWPARAQQPGDRRRAVLQPAHRRVAPEEGVHQMGISSRRELRDALPQELAAL